MIKLAQFRYYGENNPYNFPQDILQENGNDILCPTRNMLWKYKRIIKITVTTLPGIFLQVQSNNQASGYLTYIVGATGILNLDITNFPNNKNNKPPTLNIRGIAIEPTSVEILKNNPDSYFILTIIYDN